MRHNTIVQQYLTKKLTKSQIKRQKNGKKVVETRKKRRNTIKFLVNFQQKMPKIANKKKNQKM